MKLLDVLVGEAALKSSAWICLLIWAPFQLVMHAMWFGIFPETIYDGLIFRFLVPCLVLCLPMAIYLFLRMIYYWATAPHTFLERLLGLVLVFWGPIGVLLYFRVLYRPKEDG